MKNCEFEVLYLENSKPCRSSSAHNSSRVRLTEEEIPLGRRISCSLLGDGKIRFVSARLTLPFQFEPQDRILTNGFQSWSITQEKTVRDKEPRLGLLQRATDPIFHIRNTGDGVFYENKNKEGVLHSHSYSYVRRGGEYTLFGSLTERNGYVCFETDVKNGVINALLDIEGHEHTGEKQLFDIVILKGGEDEVFDGYFAQMGIKKPAAKKLKGFSSWYNYYQKVTQADILRAVEDFAKLDAGCDIIQIDDGYEPAVGDWTTPDRAKFPSDFSQTIARIKERFLAGLWLAPFVCESRSETYKNHKDWFVKGKNGKPIKVGMNWSGIYALDIYNSEVREHLKNVFDYVFNTLKIDLVKLDFLYAVAIHVPKDKTRGEVMRDGMELLRELCGDKLILGCGVPLGSSFGLVDYCRVGADVALAWEDSAIMKMAGNERVSTIDTIKDTLARRQLDGRAFLNDPDVFHIRDDNLSFTDSEKDVLRTVNALLGSVVFTSDDLSKYARDGMLERLRDSFELADAKVIGVEQHSSLSAVISYERGGKRFAACINGEDSAAELCGVSVSPRSVVTKEI